MGQAVRLKEFVWKGRHKIQDRWNPVVHRVIKAPHGNGAVYTVAPEDDLARVKRVHRTLLKAIVGMAASEKNPAPLSISLDRPAASECSSDDEDLMAAVGDTILPPAAQPAGEVQTAPASAIPVASTAPLPAALPAHLMVQPTSVNGAPLAVPLPVSEAVRRRTTRPTAGQHSNFHHLPRPANEVAQAGPSAGQSNAVFAVFRPWS